MKKILLFSFLLVSTVLFTNNVAFANSKKTTPNQIQHLEKLFEKIQADTLLPKQTKADCVNFFQKQLAQKSLNLNLEQKKKINFCINAMYSKKFEVMKSKVEKLKDLITRLKESGKKVKDLEKSLEQAEAGLRLLKAAL